MKDITIAELYSLDETIAKDIFEGVTYPWEYASVRRIRKAGRGYLDCQRCSHSTDRIDQWSLCYRKRRPDPSVCIYQGKCNCRRRSSGWELHGIKECHFV